MSVRWSYRLVRHEHPDDVTIGVHEVYRDDAGRITAWSPEPAIVEADSSDELRDLLTLVQAAFEHPVLDARTLPHPHNEA